MNWWLIFALGEMIVTWSNPTHNTDNTPIPATGPTALAETLLDYSLCLNGAVDPAETVRRVEPQPSERHVVPALPAGEYCIQAYAVNNQASVSDPSNIATKTIIIPQVPGMLTVTDMVAHTILFRRNRLVLLPIGTVPGGTQCDPTQIVNDHYAVPVEVVVWTNTEPGAVRPEMVVAKCG